MMSETEFLTLPGELFNCRRLDPNRVLVAHELLDRDTDHHEATHERVLHSVPRLQTAVAVLLSKGLRAHMPLHLAGTSLLVDLSIMFGLDSGLKVEGHRIALLPPSNPFRGEIKRVLDVLTSGK